MVDGIPPQLRRRRSDLRPLHRRASAARAHRCPLRELRLRQGHAQRPAPRTAGQGEDRRDPGLRDRRPGRQLADGAAQEHRRRHADALRDAEVRDLRLCRSVQAGLAPSRVRHVGFDLAGHHEHRPRREQPQGGERIDLHRLRQGSDFEAVGEGQDGPAVQVDPAALPAGRKAERRVQLLRHGGRLHDGRHAEACGAQPDARKRAAGGDPSRRDEPVPASGRPDQDVAEGLPPHGPGQASPLPG